MRISSLLKSSLILSVFLFSKSSIGVSNVWSEVSPLCNPSLTNFTIDATAKYSYGKQIYFFTGSMVSVVDTTTNRVINSSKINEHYDCYGKRVMPYVDVASEYHSRWDIPKYQRFQFSRFGTFNETKFATFLVYENSCFGGPHITPIGDRRLTLDETSRIYTHKDYLRLTRDYQNPLQLMVHYSEFIFLVSNPNLMSYYLRMRTRNGTKEVAIVIDQSDPSSELSQLNGHNITSLLYLPPSMSNSLFKGEQIILFANRYLTYVFIEPNKWIPFRVKNFAEVVCRTSSATEPTEAPETTITTTSSSPTGIESPICKHSVTDLTIDSTAKHRDRKHIYFFTGEEITVVDTTRNQLNHSSKIADYFIGSTDDWHSADLAISDNNLVIYQFDQDNDTQLSISYDSLQIVDRNTSTPDSWLRSHLDLDFELHNYFHLIRRPDHLLIGWNNNENYVLYQLKVRSQHIGLTNSTDRTWNLVQLNGHDITSLILLPDYMSNDVFRSGKILLFANRFFTEVLYRPNKWTPFKVKNYAEVICQNSWITTTTTTTTSTTTTSTTTTSTTTTSTTTSSTTTQRPTQSTSITTTKATKPTITSTTTKASKRTEPTITFTTTKRTKRTKTTDWMHIEIQTDNISAILISIFLLLLLCVIAFIVWFVFIRDKPREEIQPIQQRPEYNATSGPPQVVSPNAANQYQSEDQSIIAPTNPSVEQTSPVMQPIQQSQEYYSYPSEAQTFESNPTLEPQSEDEYQYPPQTPLQHQYTPQPQQQSFDD